MFEIRTSEEMESASANTPELATNELSASNARSQTPTNGSVTPEDKQIEEQSDDERGVNLLFDSVFLRQNSPRKINLKK